MFKKSFCIGNLFSDIYARVRLIATKKEGGDTSVAALFLCPLKNEPPYYTEIMK